jgi:hypothetical protein
MTNSRTELRIATRGSPLALWQAEHVKARLEALHPGLEVSLLTMKTRGDKLLDAPLAKVGGKGLFVKELEAGLLDGRADLAVHSLKDVPVQFPDGLELALVMEREDPRDAFVSNTYDSLSAMPAGSLVGTSSLRRQTQIRERYPALDRRRYASATRRSRSTGCAVMSTPAWASSTPANSMPSFSPLRACSGSASASVSAPRSSPRNACRPSARVCSVSRFAATTTNCAS